MKAGQSLIIVILFAGVLSGMLILPVPTYATPTETLISTNTSIAVAPAIYGDYIVWQDAREGNDDIFLYNILTGNESRITTNPDNQRNPKIFRDLIVWEDYRSGFYTPSIYLYNITTRGPELQISDGTSYQTGPTIYGNKIVWSDDRTGPYQIFLNGTTPGSESPINANPGGYQNNPAIFSDLVVWSDDRSGTDQDIYLYNLTSSSETQITSGNNDQVNAAIFGPRSVWEDWRNGDIEIFINGTTPGLEYSISPNEPGVSSWSPAIFDKKVVWAQTNLSGLSDIAMNDTSTGTFLPISTYSGSDKEKPTIYIDPLYGDRVVWLDDRSGYYQVYLYSSTGPGTCPVADFTSNFTGGSAPATIQFTDVTPAGPTHWFWDFGDGYNSTEQNPIHTYADNTPYTVSLTVSNPWCRNATVVSNYVVVGKPVADFTASPTYGVMPVTVQFTETSAGNPGVWNWSFGDGSPWFNTTDPALKDPIHDYTTAGMYTVNLTVSNQFGTDTRSRTGYITVFNGANNLANTTIDGVSFNSCSGGSQIITVDTGRVTATLTPNTSVLEMQPPSDRGFGTITVYALDGTGFTSAGPIISGHVTGVHFQTLEIAPTTFSGMTGPVSVDYSVDLPAYPCNATLNTQIWEGATPADSADFVKIALSSVYTAWYGTLYTTKITKTGFPSYGAAQLHMSANATWDTIKGGHDRIHIERITDDRYYGEVLPTRFLSNDPVKNLDLFEADSPHGLSTFGISALSGSGNPLQLITLTVTSHVEPPAPNPAPATDSGTGPAATAAPAVTALAPTAAPTAASTSVLLAATATPEITASGTSPPVPMSTGAPAQAPAPQPPSAPSGAVGIFTSLVSWAALAIAGNPVVVAVVFVAGLAAYLFTRQ